MSIRKPFILLSLIISSFLLLSACGDDSADMAAPAETPAAKSASSSDDSMSSSMKVEKAEGVVYQDEIYANWPYNQD